MPSTVVHAGFALLLAAGLLKGAYDRPALAVVLLVVVLPEIDSFLGPVMPGAHRTVGHTFVLPAAAGLLLYYDTRVRDVSVVRERFADRGVRVAWVALFVHCFAHVFLDWAHLDGVNALWPLHDRFFRLEGELLLSTADGVVQTFVDIDVDPETGDRRVDAGGSGTTETVHVNNPVEPGSPAELAEQETIDRRFPIANRGWRLYLVLVGGFTVIARRLQSDPPADVEE
ncbi:metal-dependent hydrolase [Halorubrum sp. JWXQ-INN 858]|uniref:metal-dependent hydrolase n=1 Tax=Halorubrum sp. JWXQ-INN 858 TaxID=2690782 RepID=UPI001357B381|nr:metal-dependent hydrolase [Halorubrum sp. JWXQ-INN 858]MWV64950.1 metal-dependent hydrolase [Halorubrum sp. JWXQ-INN 858]